jgi:glycoside/pentoside/hexuronide:cation symporter, GPH family
MPPGSSVYTASNLQIYSWALGGVAMHGLICTFGQAMNILPSGLGVSAGLVGIATSLPRLMDAILDPFIGHVSDNTNTRWGRRKPFIILGVLIACISLFLMWMVGKEWSGMAKTIYLAVAGTVFYISWGVYSMAWSALGYELSDGYNERSKIASISGIVASVMVLINTGVYWLALRPLFKHGVIATFQDLFSKGFDIGHMNQVMTIAFANAKDGGKDEVNGMRWITGMVTVVSVAAAIIVVKNSKKHSSMFVAFSETLKNKAFMQLMVFKFFQVLGGRLFQNPLFFVGVYLVCTGDKDHYSRLNIMAGIIGAIIGFFVLPSLKGMSRKWGKRSGLIGTAAIMMAMIVIQPFILREGEPYLLLIPLTLITPLSVIVDSIIASIIPDICDQDELQHGERREGLFTAVASFMNKMELSLCVLITGLMVDFCGMKMPMYDTLDTAAKATANHKLLWASVTCGLIFNACALIASFYFKMNASQMADIHKQLEARRNGASPS